MPVQKLDYRCLGNFCCEASKCRRFLTGGAAKNCLIPMAAFDLRDRADGQCDGFLPRIQEPIRVESEGGLE
jgi:hypothetical protein